MDMKTQLIVDLQEVIIDIYRVGHDLRALGVSQRRLSGVTPELQELIVLAADVTGSDQLLYAGLQRQFTRYVPLRV